jgi:hypothetical protein
MTDIPQSGADSGQPPRRSDWAAAAALAAGAATLVVLPLVLLGNVSGHDVEFHLPNWIDVARHWREGVFYPHWSGGGHFGFGDPRYIIYPPFSWLIGGALATLLPGVMLPGVYVWIAVALTALTVYRLAREWFAHGAALWAAALYALNPYLLLVVSHRSAYPELLAASVFPLAFLFASRLGRSGVNERRNGLALAVAFACVWLSNVPAAVIASYALGFVLLWHAVRARSPRPLLCGGLALALGLGLAAFYILPVAAEMSWIQSEGAFSGGLSVENNLLFNRSDDEDHTVFNLLVSELACAELALAGVAFPLALGRINKEKGRENQALREALPVLLSVAALYGVLLFRWSKPIWLLMPRLWMAEFPWRSLYILNLALVVAIVAVGRGMLRKAVWGAVVVALWMVMGGAILVRAPWLPDEVHGLIEEAESQAGYVGVVDEFLPRGVNPEQLDSSAPLVGLADAEDEDKERPAPGVRILAWHCEEKRIAVESTEAVRLRLHLLNYPAWRATVNGRAVTPEAEEETGQMILTAPPGKSELRAWFGNTADRTAGASVSLGAVAILLVLALRRRA